MQSEIIEQMYPLPKRLGCDEYISGGRSGRGPIRGTDRLFGATVAGRLPILENRVLALQPAQLNDRGVAERTLDELRMRVRIAHGWAPEQTVGVIDSQIVPGRQTRHSGLRGYDADDGWWRGRAAGL